MSETVATLALERGNQSLVVNIDLRYVVVQGKDYVVYNWRVRPFGPDGLLPFDGGQALIGPDPTRPPGARNDWHVIYLLVPATANALGVTYDELLAGKLPAAKILGRIVLPHKVMLGDLPADGNGRPITVDGDLILRTGPSRGWAGEGWRNNNTAVLK